MHPPISPERWAAIRALREGQRPTFPLLAVATKVHVSTIRERASRDNWEKQFFPRTPAKPGPLALLTQGGGAEALPPGWDEMAQEQRLQWLNDFVSRQIAQIAASAEGGTLDKARLDALGSMVRMVKGSLALAQDVAAETQTGSDDELAERLRRIDDRIIELAEAHAEWLVNQRHGKGMG